MDYTIRRAIKDDAAALFALVQDSATSFTPNQTTIEPIEMSPKVRATAVLLENDHLLLAEQKVTESLSRSWSLPGGTLEFGETLEECVIREVKEETGLDVVVDKLLYVCDRILDECHVVHITFAVKRVGGKLQVGIEPEIDADPIQSVKMVPLSELRQYGFSERFCHLARSGFPSSGTYQGSIYNIGL